VAEGGRGRNTYLRIEREGLLFVLAKQTNDGQRGRIHFAGKRSDLGGKKKKGGVAHPRKKGDVIFRYPGGRREKESGKISFNQVPRERADFTLREGVCLVKNSLVQGGLSTNL